MNGKRRISSQSKIPGRDDLSSRGRRMRSPIPISHFCTGGCILAREDARTMRAFSSPIHVRVRFHFSCLASRARCMMMDRHHAPAAPSAPSASSVSSASVDIGRARGALVQGRAGAKRHGRTKDDQLDGMALACPPPSPASISRPRLPSRTKAMGDIETLRVVLTFQEAH